MTTYKQKISLVLFGIILAIFLIEIGLRIGGFVYLTLQEFRNKKAIDGKDTFRILCLGESTTNSWDEENDYPAQLERILNQRFPQVYFSVINEGIPGTDTSAILLAIEGNLDKYRPHMVITMMGVNDDTGMIISGKGSFSKARNFVKAFRMHKLTRLIIQRAKEISLMLHPGRIAQEKYFKEGRRYMERLQYSKAEEVFRKLIGIAPDNEWAYIELGRSYGEQKKDIQAQEMFEKAIILASDKQGLYLDMGWYFSERGKLTQAEEMIKKAIETNPKDNLGYQELGQYYYFHRHSYPLERAYFNELAVTTSQYYNNQASRNNYNRLKDILTKRGIKLVCMQYPMRPLSPLKNVFDSPEGIIFVDNEKIFKKALQTGKYEDYFEDRFAGDFGHCTVKGNRLLADSAAGAILKEYFNQGKVAD